MTPITESFLMCLAGGLLAWRGWYLVQQYRRLARTGVFTTGVVIGHDEGPIIRFHPEGQEPIVVKPAVSPSKRRHLDGAHLGVYYNPYNPHDFVLATPEHKVTPFILLAMGAAFLAMGILELIPLLLRIASPSL